MGEHAVPLQELPVDRALGAPLGMGLVPFAGGFNADEISGPDILDDLTASAG